MNREDKALNRLMQDIEGYTPPKNQPTAGTAIGMAFLMLILALAVLLMQGCNTVAGIGADVQALAEGTQEKLSEKSEERY